MFKESRRVESWRLSGLLTIWIQGWRVLASFCWQSRPYVPSLLSFALTVSVARLISYFRPHAHWEVQLIHLHHFVFGIFILTFAGYAGLIFKGPRASFFNALLYGCGMGLTFDEFGMWFNLREGVLFRWSDMGLVIVGGVFLIGIGLVSIYRWLSSAREEIPTTFIATDAEASGD